MKLWLAISLLLVCFGSANANTPIFLSESELIRACTANSTAWIGFCDGYIQASIDYIDLNKIAVCIPQGTTRNDIFEKVLPLLSSKEDTNNALGALVDSLRAAYSCK